MPRWYHGGATVEFSMAMEAPRWHHDGPGKFHGGSLGALENSTVVIGLRVSAPEVFLNGTELIHAKPNDTI